MAKVYFLSEATLKAESILQDNVDMKVIAPTIWDVQNFYVLPILGTTLYNDLIDKVRHNTLTGNDKNLMDTYITPTMVWYCRAELPLVMNYKYFNKSVGVQNSDNMNPASLEEIGFLMNNAKNKAEWYAERLTKYLMSNQTLFPNYLNQINSNIDTIYAKRTNYTSGMVLGGSGCCKGDYNFTGIRNAPSEYNRNEGCNNC
jgi:hypothetical protein